MKDFFSHTAGGLDRCVDSIFFETKNQRFHKVRLHHSLSAGDGHSSAGLLIEINILHTDINHFINCLIFPFICQSAAGAALHTGQTSGTLIEINMNFSVLRFCDCLRGTGAYTLSAMYAVVTVVHNLYPGELRFRVGAPPAAERTSFQEDGGANAGSVVD